MSLSKPREHKLRQKQKWQPPHKRKRNRLKPQPLLLAQADLRLMAAEKVIM
jgi:hypothetical protein